MTTGDCVGSQLPVLPGGKVQLQPSPSARCRGSLPSLVPTGDFLLTALLTADTFHLHSLGSSVSLTRTATPGGQGLCWLLLSPAPALCQAHGSSRMSE